VGRKHGSSDEEALLRGGLGDCSDGFCVVKAAVAESVCHEDVLCFIGDLLQFVPEGLEEFVGECGLEDAFFDSQPVEFAATGDFFESFFIGDIVCDEVMQGIHCGQGMMKVLFFRISGSAWQMAWTIFSMALRKVMVVED